MKITPLSTRTYFSAKVLCGYMMAIFSILCLGIAGSALGVHLSAIEWLKMMALLLVGLIPFAVIGILLGHLMKVDSLGPALGGVTSLPTGSSKRPSPYSVRVDGRPRKPGS
jgi:ABC-2 type transport system permease protein